MKHAGLRPALALGSAACQALHSADLVDRAPLVRAFTPEKLTISVGHLSVHVVVRAIAHQLLRMATPIARAAFAQLL